METFERKKTALEKELEESRRTLRELKVEVGELQREYCDKKRSLDIALEEMKGTIITILLFITFVFEITSNNKFLCVKKSHIVAVHLILKSANVFSFSLIPIWSVYCQINLEFLGLLIHSVLTAKRRRFGSWKSVL